MPPPRRVKPRSADHAALGHAIKELREEAHLSQEELAERADTESPSIGRLERGNSNPTFTTLLRVARALDIELSRITERFQNFLDEKS